MARFVPIALLVLLTTASWAASPGPRVVLDFADDPGQLVLKSPTGALLTAVEGAELPVGGVLETKKTAAELRLEPNGSIVRLAPGTLFKLDALQGKDGARENGFSLAVGRIRLVAARLTGLEAAYTVRMPSSQAGVRGTDFAVEAHGDEGDWLCVKEGAVEWLARGKAPAAGQRVLVKANEFANTKSATLTVKKATAADLADKFAGLDFVVEKVSGVPGHR